MIPFASSWQVSVQRALRVWGYELRKYKFTNNAHEAIFPLSTLAPWNIDRFFSETYRKISQFTLVDKYRCYELWHLSKQTQKLKGDIVEIGTWRGGTGALLALQSQASGRNDHVFLCDTFRGLVKVDNRDNFFKNGDLAVDRKTVEKFIFENLKLNNVTILEGIFPEESGMKLSTSTIRFCHIDVDTYQSAKDALDFVWPKIVVGGIITFDDYGSHACDGIKVLVDEQEILNDRMVIYNLNGHAILFKLR